MRIRRIIAALAAACALLTGYGAADGGEVITGSFSFMKTFSTEILQETYYYSDAYFSAPSAADNPHLTTMSLALAVSTFEEGGSRFVTELLTGIGFQDIEAADMDREPAPETIGTAIGRKDTEYGTVVAVAVRGGKYKQEWASTMTVGATGDAAGFAQAAEKVNARIRDYIGRHGLKDVRIWIAGYSRGGAVADLAAVGICEDPEAYRTAPEAVYAYLFEAPGASGSDRVYPGIHSIRNRNDLIPLLLSESWGLYLNGTETLIGESKVIRTAKLDIMGMELSEDGGETDMETAVRQITDFMASELPREQYASETEGAMSTLLSFWFGRSEAAGRQLREILSSAVIETLKANPKLTGRLAMHAASALLLGGDRAWRELCDDLWEMIGPGISEGGLLTAEEAERVRDGLYPILHAFGPMIADDYAEGQGSRFATLVLHAEEILYEHYPECVFPLVRALDFFYGGEQTNTEGAP